MKVESRIGGYLEYALSEFRIVHPERLPFAESRFQPVEKQLQQLDWETLTFAVNGGLIVAVACEAGQVGELMTCFKYEFSDEIETWYDKRAGLLWLRLAATVKK